MAFIVSSRHDGTMSLLDPRMVVGKYEPDWDELTCDNPWRDLPERNDVEETAGDVPPSMAGSAQAVAFRVHNRREGRAAFRNGCRRDLRIQQSAPKIPIARDVRHERGAH